MPKDAQYAADALMENDHTYNVLVTLNLHSSAEELNYDIDAPKNVRITFKINMYYNEWGASYDVVPVGTADVHYDLVSGEERHSYVAKVDLEKLKVETQQHEVGITVSAVDIYLKDPFKGEVDYPKSYVTVSA